MRTFIVLLSIFLSAPYPIGCGGHAWAWQPAINLPVVPVLYDSDSQQPTIQGLLRGLEDRGWRTGHSMILQPIHIPYDGVQISSEGIAQIRQLIRQSPAAIVTLTTELAQSVRSLMLDSEIPVIMAPAADPIACGMVSSLLHPGQNLTGISYSEQENRRLKWMTSLAPGVKTLWVPYDHGNCVPSGVLESLRSSAEKLGLTLISSDIRDESDLDRALSTLPASVQGIFLITDPLLLTQSERILAAARHRKLPVSSPFSELTAQGALFSYAFRRYELGVQASRMVALILSGTPATYIPIEQAEPVLTINTTVAERLHMAIPPRYLRQAILVRGTGL